jgi:outer membrane cobalamin receptor
VVADIYGQELRERGRAENMVELGARYQFTPQTVLSSSIGTGFGDRSPAFRVLVGFQHALSWPLLFK